MNKFFSFVTTEPGFMFTTLIFIFIIAVGGIVTQDIIKYKSFKNNLNTIIECRKNVAKVNISQVKNVCGEVPTWENFSK